MEENKVKLHWQLFLIVLVLGLVGIFYIILKRQDIYDSAALYLGLPLLIALGFSLIPKRKTAMGSTMKGMTIALLLSAYVFQEGYICILFAAPLFYLVGAIVAWQVDKARKRKEKTYQAAAVASVIALLSLEGTSELTTMPREQAVVVTKLINANIQHVRHQIAKTPKFDDNRPAFLKIFPYPENIVGEGLEVGDIRQATFVAYKHIWWTKVQGDLAFRVIESEPDRIKFAVTKDDSYVSHYLKWQSSEVSLAAVDSTHTQVTWKHEYKRILDPFWYFGPLQYYAVKLATEQLIDRVATPELKS
jgi:hypothetical protein